MKRFFVETLRIFIIGICTYFLIKNNKNLLYLVDVYSNIIFILLLLF